MNIYNPNREERAFLYQEAQDLEPLLKNFGPLNVMVEESREGERKSFRVTFSLAEKMLSMRVQVSHRDLFSATIAAKEEAQRQLSAMLNALPRPSPVTAESNSLH